MIPLGRSGFPELELKVPRLEELFLRADTVREAESTTFPERVQQHLKEYPCFTTGQIPGFLQEGRRRNPSIWLYEGDSAEPQFLKAPLHAA